MAPEGVVVGREAMAGPVVTVGPEVGVYPEAEEEPRPEAVAERHPAVEEERHPVEEAELRPEVGFPAQFQQERNGIFVKKIGEAQRQAGEQPPVNRSAGL